MPHWSPSPTGTCRCKVLFPQFWLLPLPRAGPLAQQPEPLGLPSMSQGPLGMGEQHEGPPTPPVPAVDILEAVRQSMQTYEALYIGSLPVPRAMGKCRQLRCGWGTPKNPPPWGG